MPHTDIFQRNSMKNFAGAMLIYFGPLYFLFRKQWELCQFCKKFNKVYKQKKKKNPSKSDEVNYFYILGVGHLWYPQIYEMVRGTLHLWTKVTYPRHELFKVIQWKNCIQFWLNIFFYQLVCWYFWSLWRFISDITTAM